MKQIREIDYTLTLLPSGKVLAVGGTQGAQHLESAELKDVGSVDTRAPGAQLQ